MKVHRTRRGSTLLITMIFLALFATLALSFIAGSNLNLRQAYGYHGVQNARLSAEGGLQYTLKALGGLTIPQEEAEADLLLAVANYLSADLDSTSNMGATGITFDGTTIRTPAIDCGANDHTFQAEIDTDAAGDLRLTIHGAWRTSQRSIQIDLIPDTAYATVFDFGVASKGKIIIGGNGAILGANKSSEADILSATYSDDEAVLITASCTLGGEISTANPDSHIAIKGSPSIGGTTDKAEQQEFLNIGIGTPVFPEIDTTGFEAYAVNPFDPTTVDNDIVLDNVRIPAGTNPHFSGNVTIRGVLFIEEPNSVIFNGTTQIIGTIATEDPGDWTFHDNTIKFLGSVTSLGMEALPPEDQFKGLTDMQGSMLLAPGFGVEFSGNYSTINGAIAADKFSMTGNAGGIVYGPIICYGDTEFEVSGSAQIMIDRSRYDEVPTGFKLPVRMIAVADSYLEP